MATNHSLNLSLVLHDQELESFNIHLHEVSDEQWAVYGLAMPCFSALGLILNTLVFVVLFKDKAESSLNLLLHCLSFYDITVGLMTFWTFSWPTICMRSGLFQNYMDNVHPYLVPYLLPVWHMTITGSDYLNLATAVERYLATDRDFRKNKKKRHHLGCSTISTKWYILKIFLLTVLFNVPAFFELKTEVNEDGDLEVFETDLRKHEVYTQMYRLMAEFLIFKASPWFAFLILWLSLQSRINYYTQKRKVRRTMTVAQFEEMKDTRIVLGIIGLFYITNILTFYCSICHIVGFYISDFIIMLSKLSLLINSTFKFCIYVCFSTNFRTSLKSLYAPVPTEGH